MAIVGCRRGGDTILTLPLTPTSKSLTRSLDGSGQDTVTYSYSVRTCVGSGGARQCSPEFGTARVCVGTIHRAGPDTAVLTSYDAFGKVRGGDFSDRVNGTLNELPTTLRGFTGHEHVSDFPQAPA